MDGMNDPRGKDYRYWSTEEPDLEALQKAVDDARWEWTRKAHALKLVLRSGDFPPYIIQHAHEDCDRARRRFYAATKRLKEAQP